MTRYFTHYWKNRTVDDTVVEDGTEVLDHAADTQFAQRGVSVGDLVYVVTVGAGALFVIGKMVVGHLVHDTQIAADLLGCLATNLWDAPDHLIAARGTPMGITRVTVEDTERLRFGGNGRWQPLVFKTPGHLDQQTLRGVRELDVASAAILDRYLSPLQPAVIPGGEGALPTADAEELEQRTRHLLELDALPRPTGRRVPQRSPTITQGAFARSPLVRAWVLREAAGCCERCRQPAPFVTLAGIPYLEVHHVRPLSEGGSDTVENAVALCPNCHRLLHLSVDAEDQRHALYQQVVRLVQE